MRDGSIGDGEFVVMESAWPSKFNCSGMRGKKALDWSKFGAVLDGMHKEINMQY